MSTSADRPKVGTLGAWHLGTVVSACLADLGYAVVGYDGELSRVDQLNRGVPPLFEPRLQEILAREVARGRLRYTTHLEQAVGSADYVLFTFDTPVNEQDEVDVSEIFDTARAIAPMLAPRVAVIVNSQVPVGTCRALEAIFRSSNPRLEFSITYSPENLQFGRAIQRFLEPSMIVMGANDSRTLDKVEQLYAPIIGPRVRTDLTTAEMIKHVLNAFSATAISFMGEIANLCEGVDADAVNLAAAMRFDPRIGEGTPIQPGLGFSGGTLARDLQVLRGLGRRLGARTRVLDAVWEVNRERSQVVTERLHEIYGTLQSRVFGVLGLTTKGGTSSLRRSGAVEIVRQIQQEGGTVKAYDPKADARELPPGMEFRVVADPYQAAEGSDALIILTDWPEFCNLDFPTIRRAMRNAVLIDARNMLDPDAMSRMGFQYCGIGRRR